MTITTPIPTPADRSTWALAALAVVSHLEDWTHLFSEGSDDEAMLDMLTCMTDSETISDANFDCVLDTLDVLKGGTPEDIELGRRIFDALFDASEHLESPLGSKLLKEWRSI